MQNQSHQHYELSYDSLNLPEGFPVILGENSPPEQPSSFLHAHNCLEIGYCREGSGIFIVDHKILPFKKGDVSVIFSKEMHIAQSEKGDLSKWNFVFMDYNILIHLLSPDETKLLSRISDHHPSFLNILSCEKYPDMIQWLKALILELIERRPGYQAVVRSLVCAFMIHLGRMLEPSEEMDAHIRHSAMSRIAPAINHISQNYMYTIEIQQLSTICNISTPHLRRLFHSATGMPPMDYIHRLRIHMAVNLLNNTDKTIMEISNDVGYNSISSFNRQFKAFMKAQPRSYRK